MRSVPVRGGGRWTLLVLVALLALLALGAPSSSAGQAGGKGGGNGQSSGPNGKALGHAKAGGTDSTAPAGDASTTGGSSSAAADGDVFVMTVTPEEVSAFVGTSVLVTAHLTDGGGAALAGKPVHIRVSGVNSATANGNTDDAGDVTHTATSDVPGTDVVSACLHRDESSKGNPEDDSDSDESQKYCDTATIHWITAPADVSVSFSASPSTTKVGGIVTLTAVVTNSGPGTATGVTLTYTVPSGLELQSVSASQGECAGTSSITCELGTIEAGATATVTIVVKALAGGSYSNVVDVTGDQSDPNGNGNNMGVAITNVEQPAGGGFVFIPLEEPEAPFTPPAVGPVQGKNVDVEPVSGTVLVQLKGKKKFVPLKKLRRIPVGSTVDVSDGVVKLTSAVNKKGRLQAAVFYDGTFVVKQKKRALTELILTGGDFSDCDEPEAARTTQSHRKKPRQKLWGNGTGQFQTSGQFSSATVRGTKWYVIDTCDGTLTAVKRGVVKVYDFTLKRYFVLEAGDSHWAKKPK